MSSRRDRPLPFAAIVCILAVLAAACAAPPPASGGFTAFSFVPRPSFVVRVHPSLASRTDEVMSTARAAAAAVGVTVTLGPPATSLDPSVETGEVVAYVGAPCGHGAIGCTTFHVDSPAGVLAAATVSVTPPTVNAPELRTVLLHEFGHVFGLDHFDAPFEGSLQVMNSRATAGSPREYRSGDMNGLRAAGEQSRARIDGRSPTGRLETVTATPGKVRVIGWAADPDSSRAATVAVSVDGQVVRQTWTNRWRADIAKKLPSAPPFSGVVVDLDVPAGRHQVCLAAANIGWGTDRVLGCSTITVPALPQAPSTTTTTTTTVPPTAPWPLAVAPPAWTPRITVWKHPVMAHTHH